MLILARCTSSAMCVTAYVKSKTKYGVAPVDMVHLMAAHLVLTLAMLAYNGLKSRSSMLSTRIKTCSDF